MEHAYPLVEGEAGDMRAACTSQGQQDGGAPACLQQTARACLAQPNIWASPDWPAWPLSPALTSTTGQLSEVAGQGKWEWRPLPCACQTPTVLAWVWGGWDQCCTAGVSAALLLPSCCWQLQAGGRAGENSFFGSSLWKSRSREVQAETSVLPWKRELTAEVGWSPQVSLGCWQTVT